MKIRLFWAGALAALTLVACSGAPDAADRKTPVPQSRKAGPAKALPGAVKPAVHTHKVIAVHPHAPDTFTQGLFFLDGFLYESSGNYGASSLRKTDIETGEVLQIRRLEDHYFGEGITLWNDTIILLTWQEATGFVFDLETFEEEKTFGYFGEGWGLTNNDTHLIQSDGTNVLRFLDPDTFKIEKTLTVRMNGRPLQEINELEWINGQIWANVWQSDILVQIDPENGNVVGVVDLANLYPQSSRANPKDDVLNGIAYNPGTDRFYVTGKKWPSIYEIEITEFAPPE